MSRRWSGFPRNVEIADRRRRGAVRAARRAHVRRRRRPHRASGSRAANFEDNRRPRTFSAEQARRDLTIALLRGQGPALPDFADAPPDDELTRAERAAWDIYAIGRAAAARAAGAAPGAALRVPAPARLHRRRRRRVRAALGRRRRLTFAGDPGDLRGDRRRRPRRRRRSPSTSSARSSSIVALSASQPSPRSRLSEVVGGDGVVEVDRRASPRAAGATACAMSVMSCGVEVGLDRLGRIPLLDHQESTTLRGRHRRGRRCGIRRSPRVSTT